MAALKSSVLSSLKICPMLIIAGCILPAELSAQSGPPRDSQAKVRSVSSHALPQLDGEHLKMKIVEVDYAPGESSSPHSHPCPVTVYILSGAVRMQVKGGPERVLKAGDTFYEAPNGIHQVSANASQTETAKFLAIFVCDHDTPLTVRVSGSRMPVSKAGERK